MLRLYEIKLGTSGSILSPIVVCCVLAHKLNVTEQHNISNDSHSVGPLIIVSDILFIFGLSEIHVFIT